MGTGKYLKDAGNANHDDPTYFSFCTLATTTGLSSVAVNRNRNGAVYDLQGRRINEHALRPGLYIKDGHKVVIK